MTDTLPPPLPSSCLDDGVPSVSGAAAPLRWEGSGTLMERLGMVLVERGVASTVVEMPVAGALQPAGFLHGGASAALVETAASVAALEAAPDGLLPVGAELQVSHFRPVREGMVRAEARPVYVGRRSAVHEVLVTDEEGRLVSRGTLRSMYVEPSL